MINFIKAKHISPKNKSMKTRIRVGGGVINVDVWRFLTTGVDESFDSAQSSALESICSWL